MDETILIETIKRMKDSGLEDDVILDTLEDVGISRERGKILIEKSSGKTTLAGAIEKKDQPIKKPLTVQAEKEVSENKDEFVAEGTESEIGSLLESAEPDYIETEEKEITTAERIMGKIDDTKLEHDLHHTTLQAAVVQQTGMIEDLHKTVGEAVNKKPECPKTMSEQVTKMQSDIEKIKEDIDALKGDIAAMKELMEKVLESTKKVLLRMS
ncbi:MAG: hypothetical protein N3F05_04500 [Candidatus Diapherotrites archaeon]|nr:hypothetical protein [Candidatus Diapherotrites archaeon]